MKCSTLECHSVAVAESRDTGQKLCVECAIKIARHFGPATVRTLEGAKFPWEYPANKTCPSCKIGYNQYLIGATGDCPSCRRPLAEYSRTWEGTKVTYGEGPHD